jgi:hypothetical protein
MTSAGILATAFARVLQIHSPQKQRAHATLNRGRGEDRVRAAPAVSCAKVTNKNAHEHTGSAETLRPSPRNGFNGLSSCSPRRDHSLLVTVARVMRSIITNLTPAIWGVRTTRLCRPRQPRSSVAAFASTASRRAFRDVRNAPLVGRDGVVLKCVGCRGKVEYFLRRGWTGFG